MHADGTYLKITWVQVRNRKITLTVTGGLSACSEGMLVYDSEEYIVGYLLQQQNNALGCVIFIPIKNPLYRTMQSLQLWECKQ